MVENSNGNGRGVECTECEPRRQFKNKAGLNGIHNSSMAAYLMVEMLCRTASNLRCNRT